MSMVDLVWLACFLDCEGSLVVVPLISRRAKTPRYQARLIIVNSNMAMLNRAQMLLERFLCHAGNTKHSAGTATRKRVRRVTVQSNAAIVRILTALVPYLMEKRDFAIAIASLFARHAEGSRWTDEERVEAERIRKTFMPRSSSARSVAFANGPPTEEEAPN